MLHIWRTSCVRACERQWRHLLINFCNYNQLISCAIKSLATCVRARYAYNTQIYRRHARKLFIWCLFYCKRAAHDSLSHRGTYLKNCIYTALDKLMITFYVRYNMYTFWAINNYNYIYAQCTENIELYHHVLKINVV